MRAINLIPEDRRGADSLAGRSGGAAYILLGALAVLVAVAVAWGMLGRQADTARADLAVTQARTQQFESDASSLSGFTAFSGIRDRRVATVTQLANSRVDWGHALRELARVIPADVSLTALDATTTTGATAGSSAGGDLRGAISSPAFQLTGCTTSQDAVATMLSDLRRIDGVQRVTLESSVDDTGASPSAAASTSSTATAGSGCGRRSTFSVVVFFAAPSAATPIPVSTP